MKIRIEFSKHGLMRYIGHLDMMRYFQKAIRRAEVDICYTEGFSPHQMMSFAHPLGVGVESDAEYLDIIVNSTDSSEETIRRLNETGADGLQIVSYVELPEEAKNAMSIVACADYVIGTKRGHEPFAGITDTKILTERLQAFLEQDEINVVKKTKKSETLTNIKPWIVRTEVMENPIFEDLSVDKSHIFKIEDLTNPAFLNQDFYNTEAPVIFLKALTGSHANLKPALFAESFSAFCGVPYDELAFAVTRKEVYGNTGTEEEPVFTALKDYGTVI